MIRSIALSALAASLAVPQIPTHGSQADVRVKKIRVNNVDLAYVEEGAGEAVVFVHGFTGDWRSWEALRPFISKRFRYVSLSRRYHYPNTAIDDPAKYTLVQHVEDLAAFVRALDVGKVHLVGNSGGARIVAYAALKYPELVRSMVIGDPGLISSEAAAASEARTAAQNNSAAVIAAMNAGEVQQAMRLHYDAIAGEHGAWDKLPRERQRQRLDNAHTVIPTLSGVRALPVTCEELGALGVPTLVTTGERSPANFRYGNEALLKCLPRTTAIAVIPRGHHEWYAMNPEASAKAILSFLRGASAHQPPKKILIGGTALSYVEQGTGVPVVFVHGWFTDHRIWEAQRQAVARRYRFVAVTQRYFGTERWPDGGEHFSVATHIADLAAFIRELGAGPVYLVGTSYGATISLATAVAHPELVRGLFLNEPQAPSLLTDPADQALAAEDRKMVAAARDAAAAGRNDDAMKLFLDFSGNRSGAFAAIPAAEQAMRLDNARTAAIALRAPPAQITCAQAGHLRTPVTFTKGERTRTFYRVITKAASRCIPGARLITVKGAAHNAPTQQPAAFNEALLAFLSRH
jgi:pimeloyl-ACP methyl ester carboxylesterase